MATQVPKRKRPAPGLLPAVFFATAVTAAAIAWASYTVDPPEVALMQAAHTETQ